MRRRIGALRKSHRFAIQHLIWNQIGRLLADCWWKWVGARCGSFFVALSITEGQGRLRRSGSFHSRHLVTRIGGAGALSPSRVPGYAMRTYFERPSSSMRFSTLVAMATSV